MTTESLASTGLAQEVGSTSPGGVQPNARRVAAFRYDAFISYNRDADGRIAPALQVGLQRLAKAWYQRVAISVFRDVTDLSVAPGGWAAIEIALLASKHFILLASPGAVGSKWVRREVGLWRKARPAEPILLVLTDGEIFWDDASVDFDWTTTTALPSEFARAYTSEPFWVDLRRFRQEMELDLGNPDFKAEVARIAARIRNTTPDVLIGRDYEEHKKTRRLAWSAASALVVLLIVSVAAAALFWTQRTRAQEETLRTRNLLYAADMRDAYQADANGDARRVLEILGAHSADERRSFDWSHLWRQYHGEVATARHANELRSVAYSPDGHIIATASGDEIVLWEAGARRRLRTLSSPGGTVYQVLFSPNGKRLAAGRGNGSINLWETGTWRELPPLLGHAKAVSSIAFSPREDLLASASSDSTVKLWDLATSHDVATFRGHKEFASCVAFSPDGKFVASGGLDDFVRVWSVVEKRAVKTMNNGGSISSMAFSPDGRLAVGSYGIVKFWNTPHWQPAGNEGMPGSDVSAIAFSADKRWGAFGTWSGTVKLFDMNKNMRAAANFKGHVRGFNQGAGITGLAFSPDGKSLVTASEDATLKLWNTTEQSEFGLVSGSFESIAFSPRDMLLAMGTKKGSIEVWNVRTRRSIVTLRGHEGDVSTVVFSSDGTLLASGGADRAIKLWATKDWHAIGELTGASAAITSVAFVPNSNIVVAADEKGQTRIWNSRTRQLLPAPKETGEKITSIAVSPNGHWLVRGGRDKNLRIWDMTTHTDVLPLPALERVVTAVAISPDGTMLASATSDRVVQLWALPNGARLATLQRFTSTATYAMRTVLAFSKDGKILAVANEGEGEGVALWSTRSYQELGTLKIDSLESVYSLDFSPDDTMLAARQITGVIAFSAAP